MAIKNINATHKQAMLLHAQGMSIDEIAERISRSPGIVENWFYSDQNFRDEYEKFKEEYITGIAKTARERMQKVADEAMQTLLILMSSSESDKIRLDAAKDILDRTGFKPEDILNLKGSINTEVSKLDPILNQLKED